MNRLPAKYTNDKDDNPLESPSVGFNNPKTHGANAPIKKANIIMAPDTEALILGSITVYRDAYIFES